MTIKSFDFETQELEHIADVGEGSHIVVSPHWAERYTAPGTWMFCGFNLYADGILLQTYNTKPAAIYVRDHLLDQISAGQEMAIV